MKIFLVILAQFIFCIAGIVAQSNPQIEGEEYFALAPEQTADGIIEDVILLDSLINIQLSGTSPEIVFKRNYLYDEEARVLSYKRYNWSSEFEKLYLRQDDQYTYTGNMGTRLSKAGEPESEILVNDSRNEYLYGPEEIEEDLQEYWNEDIEEWEKASRTILVWNSNGLTEKHIYDWNEIDSQYDLNAKTEDLVEGNKTTSTYFVTDEYGIFHPYSRRITKRQLPTPYITFSHRQIFNGGTEEWEDSNKREVFIDEISKTGYQLYSYSSSGNFELRDSSRLTFNDFLNPVLDTTYERNTDTGEYTLDDRREYFYYPFERIQQALYYDFDGTISSPESEINYYYSLNPDVATSTPSPTFPIALQFPNPAQLFDQVLISGKGAINYDLWITDRQGKILNRQKVRTGDTVSLDMIPSSGLYFLTLFGEEGQKTWKVNYMAN